MIIHVILSSQKGCGKTFIGWLFAQYIRKYGQRLSIIDTSNNTNSISRFKYLNAHILPLTNTKEDGTLVYDCQKLFDRILNTHNDMLIELVADAYQNFVFNLKKDDFAILKEFEERELKLVLHVPISGNDYFKNECLSVANNLLNTFTKTDVVVWLNHYPDPVINDRIASHTDMICNMFSDQGSLKHVANLPMFTKSETITDDTNQFLIKSVFEENKTFAELLDPDRYKEAVDPELNGYPLFINSTYQLSFIRNDFDKILESVCQVAV